MLDKHERMASETLAALNRDVISGQREIRTILEAAKEHGSQLYAGISRYNEARTATVVRLDSNTMLLGKANINAAAGHQLFFTLELDDIRYFFACSMLQATSERELEVTIPDSIYRAERRDVSRSASAKRQVMIAPVTSQQWTNVEVLDESIHGLSVRVPDGVANSLARELQLRPDGSSELLYGRVRHRTPDDVVSGWTKIGLSISSIRTSELIRVDRRHEILGRKPGARETLSLARAGISALVQRSGLRRNRRHRVNLIEYSNQRHQFIRGIENAWGPRRDDIAVVIPPAWGKTKEAFLPVALTLVETFRSNGEPIRVIRFDGTNRRGESYIDRECRAPGNEYLHFTFSQAAQDISATVDFLNRDSAQAPRKILLVTFSLGAVEARHALATDDRFSGWVSVVGMPDMQSALRTISGGIDYGSGLLKGVRFGRHELAGVSADMDLTGLDAIASGIGFLEDARREMSKIQIPITWIHGKYDAWMDLDRVIESMSCGRSDNRRILEVPTGHQLRSGHKALSTFQLIAEEVSEMALGHRKRGVIPRVSRVAAARTAELARIPREQADIRAFWSDYLLGRSRVVGMELLTATAAYQDFMDLQVRMLQIEDRQRVVDLGAGNGEFSLCLQRLGFAKELSLIELDFVEDALRRARSRRALKQEGEAVSAHQCLGNLDLQLGKGIPLATGSTNRALASLILSYVNSPERLLRETHRILKPGGRIVVSSMIQDADPTMLFHDGLLEYATAEARSSIGAFVNTSFESLVRDFVNDGSRLLDLEEKGRFRFWDEAELRHAVANAGFGKIQSREAFGNPPQAIVVSGLRV